MNLMCMTAINTNYSHLALTLPSPQVDGEKGDVKFVMIVQLEASQSAKSM